MIYLLCFRYPTDICNMYLLLTAATAGEIYLVREFLEKKEFRLGEWEVEILLTGVGSVATTYLLSKSFFNRRPTVAVQLGIAGAFVPNKTGDVVTIKEDGFADLGVWENGGFRNIFNMGLADAHTAPYSNSFLVNPWGALSRLAGLQEVRAITVNEISTDAARIEWYNKNLSPLVESMEGAAFHYVCLQENIPFLQLRSISNDIGERDKSKWEMKKAITQLNEKFIDLLNSIAKHDETYFRI